MHWSKDLPNGQRISVSVRREVSRGLAIGLSSGCKVSRAGGRGEVGGGVEVHRP